MSTQLLEYVVEGKLIAAVAALALPDVTVQGFWQPALQGQVKKANASDGIAHVFCAVQPRAFGSYGTPTVRFTATVTVYINAGKDPRGEQIAPTFKAVMDLCMAWKQDAEAASAALSQTGEFACDGVTIQPGGALGVSNDRWSVSIQMEIAGTEV